MLGGGKRVLCLPGAFKARTNGFLDFIIMSWTNIFTLHSHKLLPRYQKYSFIPLCVDYNGLYGVKLHKSILRGPTLDLNPLKHNWNVLFANNSFISNKHYWLFCQRFSLFNSGLWKPFSWPYPIFKDMFMRKSLWDQQTLILQPEEKRQPCQWYKFLPQISVKVLEAVWRQSQDKMAQFCLNSLHQFDLLSFNAFFHTVLSPFLVVTRFLLILNAL